MTQQVTIGVIGSLICVAIAGAEDDHMTIGEIFVCVGTVMTGGVATTAGTAIIGLVGAAVVGIWLNNYLMGLPLVPERVRQPSGR